MSRYPAAGPQDPKNRMNRSSQAKEGDATGEPLAASDRANSEGEVAKKASAKSRRKDLKSGRAPRKCGDKPIRRQPGVARLYPARDLRSPAAAEALMQLAYQAGELTEDLSDWNNEMERLLGVALPKKSQHSPGEGENPDPPTLLPFRASWDQMVLHCAAFAPMTEGLHHYLSGLADTPEDLSAYLRSGGNQLAVAALFYLAQLVGYFRQCDRVLNCLSVWKPWNPAYEILMILRYIKIEARTEEHMSQCGAALERLAKAYFKNPLSPQARAAQEIRLGSELDERAKSSKRSRGNELQVATMAALFPAVSRLEPGLTPDQQIRAVQRSLEPTVMDDLLGPGWRMRFREGREVPMEGEFKSPDGTVTAPQLPPDVSEALVRAAIQRQATSTQQRLEDESAYKELMNVAARVGVSEPDLELLMAQGSHHGGLKEKAAEQGVTEAAAKMRVSRARKKLREVWAVYKRERSGERADNSSPGRTDVRPLGPIAAYLLGSS